MKKFTLQASAALQALALLGAGAGAAFVAAPAVAQDLTSGGITGTVTDEAGAPVGGASVTLRSLAQGQVRTFTTNATGTFTASGLAPGQYELTVNASGFSPSADVITIAQATSSAVVVSLVAPAAADGDTIVVRGRARQVQTQGTTGQNINVAKINEQLPIGHDITSITLLAPTTSRGVSGFVTASGESVPSVGGGSVAENAYYVNGLNITNPDTYVGSARVPFYFYQNVDVQTGGYPAEFGRATGGVINATTKSGSNIPFAALHLDWEPDWLQAERQNRGDPDSLTEEGKYHKDTTRQATIEAGGAVVPDHLFVYGLLQINRNKSEGKYPSSGVFERTVDRDPFWGIKVDGYITPTQHAEFTIFDTRNTQRIYDYGLDGNGDIDLDQIPLEAVQESGGLGWVARYTGEVTPFLTLSGAYGKVNDAGTFAPADAASYYIEDRRSGSVESIGNPFGSVSLLDTKRRFYRGDADIRATFAGQHQFRMGFDHEDLEEIKTSQLPGAVSTLFRYRTNGIQYIYQLLGGEISAKNTSFYLQDSWTGLVDGLTLNLGIRNDRFKQFNLSGEQYLDLKNNWGPRFGFSYTPPSADQWRFFGSYGRYFIPPAMNLGFRGRDLYYAQYFSYGAYTASTFPIDPATGMPLAPVGAPLTNVAGYDSPCPPASILAGAPGNPTGNGTDSCLILGAGVQDPALAKLALDAKATYENEFILGTRYRMNSLWNFGLAATRRTLKRVSEDSDLQQNLIDYYGCDDLIYDEDDPAYDPTVANFDRCVFYEGNSTYYIINPGSDTVEVNDWYDALQGIETPITLTGIPYSTPKRKYTALTFDWARGDDGLWFGGGSVTWSKSIGSTEGTVKSDAGASAQDDAGSTQDFDYPGLADYNYGYLPNHRRWTFKAYGSIHATKQLLLGANVLVQSKMLGSCQSHHPTDGSATGYGASSFYCPTGEKDFFGNYTEVEPSPRGTGVRSDWLKQIDVSARYNIPLGATDNRKLTLRADIFNLFNFKSVRQRYSTATQTYASYCDTPGCTYNGEVVPDELLGAAYFEPSKVYNTPQSYQTPRYVRLGLDLLWGGAPALAPVVETPPPPPPPAPAPATQTCADGSVILATDACPVPPPPPPPAPAPERG